MAAELGWRFIDTDELIVNAHGNILKIFAVEGEPAFRHYESEAIAVAIAAQSGDAAVIAVSGGSLLDASNRALLLGDGEQCFWLDAAPEQIAERLRRRDGADPPLPPTGDEARPLEERIAVLLSERINAYRAFTRVDASPQAMLVALSIVSVLERA